MSGYMTPDSPQAFLGMEKKDRPACEEIYGDPIVECPKCHGYGGWHLRLNAYGEGVHFNAGCGQCSGWGYVLANSTDATCIHEYREISQAECRELGVAHYGMCYHVYRCTKCGRIMAQDSSD